jgi:hypothetical protein
MIQLARIILSHAISESHGTRLVYKKNESTYGRINNGWKRERQNRIVGHGGRGGCVGA